MIVSPAHGTEDRHYRGVRKILHMARIDDVFRHIHHSALGNSSTVRTDVGPIFFSVSSFLRAVQSVAAAQNAVELPAESQRPDENQASDDRGLRE